MSDYLYNKWKNNENLPLECLINIMFLYNEHREIVQFDITYYESKKVRDTILEFVDSLTKNRINPIIKRKDSNGNIVVYLKEKQEQVEKKLLKIGKGSIDGAFRTSEFADMLDPVFYSLKGKFPSIFNKNRIVQVSINIIDLSGRTGAILIQMSNVRIAQKIPLVYNYFIKVSKHIEEIDSSLQTSFMFHTKPGLWRKSPELVVSKYKELP